MPVAEVCFADGFGSLTRFNTALCTAYGTTPQWAPGVPRSFEPGGRRVAHFPCRQPGRCLSMVLAMHCSRTRGHCTGSLSAAASEATTVSLAWMTANAMLARDRRAGQDDEVTRMLLRSGREGRRTMPPIHSRDAETGHETSPEVWEVVRPGLIASSPQAPAEDASAAAGAPDPAQVKHSRQNNLDFSVPEGLRRAGGGGQAGAAGAGARRRPQATGPDRPRAGPGADGAGRAGVAGDPESPLRWTCLTTRNLASGCGPSRRRV